MPWLSIYYVQNILPGAVWETDEGGMALGASCRRQDLLPAVMKG